MKCGEKRERVGLERECPELFCFCSKKKKKKIKKHLFDYRKQLVLGELHINKYNSHTYGASRGGNIIKRKPSSIRIID